ncbi:hypothetical protein DMC47_34795 [Nostoc sp. 3335mG]|nr:hypothetical protein DMC47_34795 [Nostoc sp. 3335mG]
MACCVLAALLLGQLIALLRRWGIFWGLVRARDYEDGSNTALNWAKARLATPRAKRALAAAFVVEVGLLGTWVYTRHGAHLYRLADVAVSRMQGERIVYIGVCTPKSDDHYVRVVLNRRDRA